MTKNTAGNKRTTHRIRPNQTGSIPACRVFVDTEAHRVQTAPDTETQTLSFGWAVRERIEKGRTGDRVSEEWIRFETPTTFFLWLQASTRPKSATYVYAHNWSYDAAILSLQRMAAEHCWDVTEYVTSQHILWITMRRDDRTLVFIDTLNYFATSLATLGVQIGWHKLDMPHETADSDTWDTYCKNDVSLIRYAMGEYFACIKANELGKYRKTAASQAFGAWRHRFMNHTVLILADPEIEALERAAYHGGRSEVFYDKPIQHTVFALDINSMYPSVMRDFLFPARKRSKGKSHPLESFDKLLKDNLVIAEVMLSTNEPCYAHVSDNRLIFPVGHFLTVLSTPELQYALAHGHIVSVGRWVSYEPQPLFAEYVDTLYALRNDYKQQGNHAFAFLVKLLLNSLYGKFGQKGRYWEPCDASWPPSPSEWVGNCESDGPAYKHRRRFGIVQHQLDDSEAFESFPAIAAHVTAYARMKLWQLIKDAGDSNVYYCDTDSLYVNQAGYIALSAELDDITIGKLKLEKRYSGLHCYAPKDYHWIDGYKVKGIRKSARRVNWREYADKRPDDTKRIALLRTGRYQCFEQVQFESYDSVLARGEDGEIRVTTIWKVVTRINRKSISTSTGWRKPLTLSL